MLQYFSFAFKGEVFLSESKIPTAVQYWNGEYRNGQIEMLKGTVAEVDECSNHIRQIICGLPDGGGGGRIGFISLAFYINTGRVTDQDP